MLLGVVRHPVIARLVQLPLAHLPSGSFSRVYRGRLGKPLPWSAHQVLLASSLELSGPDPMYGSTSVEKAVANTTLRQIEHAIYIGIPDKVVVERFDQSGRMNLLESGLHCVLRMLRDPEDEKRAVLCLEPISVFKNNGVGPLYAYPSESGTCLRAIQSDPGAVLFDFHHCNSGHWAAWCAKARLRSECRAVSAPLPVGTIHGPGSRVFLPEEPRQSILYLLFPNSLNLCARGRRMSKLLLFLEQRRANAPPPPQAPAPLPSRAPALPDRAASPCSSHSSDAGSERASSLASVRRLAREASMNSSHSGGDAADALLGQAWFRAFWHAATRAQ